MIATWLLGWKWLKTIGINVNRSKPKAFAVAEKMKRELEKRGVDVCFEPDIAADLGYPDLGLPLEEFANRVELVFVLGGDGTLLGAARQLARYQIPILGFNLGNLGFLSEAETGGLSEAIERVLSGDYVIECRLMLEAEVIRNGRVNETGVALNDVGIAKGFFGRMIDLHKRIWTGIFSEPIQVMGHYLHADRFDCLFLVLRRPIVYPGIRALLLTPICSHTLTSRPMVLPSESVIDIHVSAVHREMGITIDGQIGYCLKEGDIVRVKRYKHSALLIKWQDRSFFEVVRQKLQGESVDVSMNGGGTQRCINASCSKRCESSAVPSVIFESAAAYGGAGSPCSRMKYQGSAQPSWLTRQTSMMSGLKLPRSSAYRCRTNASASIGSSECSEVCRSAETFIGFAR